MQWCDFYGNFWDWSDSTRRTRISSLEDMGPGEEIVDVALEIEDEKVKAQLIRKAMKLGTRFSHDDYANLYGELPDDVYAQLGKYTGYGCTDPFFGENDVERDEASAEFACTDMSQRRRKRARFWGALIGIGNGLAKAHARKKDPHRCDGDCDNCPAHYGYRYGRWYYGHGHQHGCERGGNGGASGKMRN